MKKNALPILIQPDGSENRRFLRQLAGEPNPEDFPENAHVCRHKSAHVYQLSLGQDRPDTTGLWVIQCPYVVKTAKEHKCAPVVAQKPANWKNINLRYIRALDEFKQLDSAAGRLLDGIKKVDENLLVLHQLSDVSPPHDKARLRIGA